MPDFTSDIVLDVSVSSRGESGDFLVFAGGVAISALGIVRGLDIVRVILSHPGLHSLRRSTEKACEPVPVNAARVKYPFLFLGAEKTNPLLYREF